MDQVFILTTWLITTVRLFLQVVSNAPEIFGLISYRITILFFVSGGSYLLFRWEVTFSN